MNITGTKVPKAGFVISTLVKPDVSPGLYLVKIIVWQNGLTASPAANGRYKQIYIQDMNTSGANYTAREYISETYSGYLMYTASAFYVATESGLNIRVSYENSIETTVRTMGSGSLVNYEGIKLCDI